jgi:3-dehydroquinate synthase
MAVVSVELPHHQYDVTVEPGALERLGALVRAAAPDERCAIVGDEAVLNIYGGPAEQALRRGGFEAVVHAVPSGERHKTLETVRGVYDTLLAAKLERRSPVIALGGGVVGDTAGFAAATYLRGVPFVQCPTSLLAMVDASVGGKVGVNVPQGKNLIGAFYQPMAVVVDPLVLQTLPPRELRCGLAECVKHGVIRDPGLFDWIEERVARIQAIDPAVMTELVARNVAIKARVVEEDEKESGVRAHLNFGHTFAHAIEATSGYGTIEHGEAVALGMAAATQLAVDLGRCDAALLARLTALLEKIGLPTRAELAATEELLAAMRLDKKVKAGRMRLVLPDRLGAVSIVEDAPEDAVRAAWESIRA